MFLLRSIRLEWADKILELSAKSIGSEDLFIILGKSFIYIKEKIEVPK
jgi:hypothetical protein